MHLAGSIRVRDRGTEFNYSIQTLMDDFVEFLL